MLFNCGVSEVVLGMGARYRSLQIICFFIIINQSALIYPNNNLVFTDLSIDMVP